MDNRRLPDRIKLMRTEPLGATAYHTIVGYDSSTGNEISDENKPYSMYGNLVTAPGNRVLTGHNEECRWKKPLYRGMKDAMT